jgi:hypothetical protein
MKGFGFITKYLGMMESIPNPTHTLNFVLSMSHKFAPEITLPETNNPICPQQSIHQSPGQPLPCDIIS